jgi:hypothetical protein
MRHRLAAPFFAVLVLALAAFTGAALAGDGHGNGGSSNGNGNTDKQSSTSAGNPATGGSNAQGVKPSNTTKHDTHATASSDQTKKYGNGQTAGQIATNSGHGDATLHGPGNSQPHKTTACPGGHEVDVHALKNKNGTCTSSSQKGNSQQATSKAKQGEVKSSEHANAKSENSRESGVAAQKTEEQKTEAHGVAASAHAHVTICHATGSSSNPYVRISPSAAGVFHGHLGHQDGRDIVPPFTWNGTTYSENWTDAGMAIFNAGCTVPSTSAATLTPLAPATLTPLAPATLTPLAPATPAPLAPATTAAGSVLGTQATVTPAASSPTATPAAAGGVKGAAVALKPTKTKPAGGVLGTTTRLGGSVAATRLPFTGLPLWIFALVAAGLIGVGLAMRRTAANNRS